MLSRIHRLAKEADITRVLRRGRKFFDPLFTVRMLFDPSAVAPRFAIVISTKVSKRATRRNRIRRLLRELLRVHMQSIRPGDYLIQVQPRAAQVPEAALVQALRQLLEKARIISP